ncbi:MAG TPA: TonB-dependent receptor [Tepidisphaeraceae bacterium]|nr:TonB-dependent receptor [Tepidisphaeraceae bacterium]
MSLLILNRFPKVTGRRRSKPLHPSIRNPARLLSAFSALLINAAALEVRAQTPQSPPTSQQTSAPEKAPSPYKKMSLDELMDIELMQVEVTSVSRRESTVGQSPSAVSVITQEDIRRSGALSIPETLRMAPGLEVAQIDNSTWAISARGFNSSTANKLLVLMDGRSVYTPLYSGVFWDVQDTLIEDIDRIEVIRGPAGALWGANAVNGVINIITKDAADTQGLFVRGGVGTEQRDFIGARYGWKIADNAFARVYAKHFERDETVLSTGADGGDDFLKTQTGFRIDWRPSTQNHYTLQGDIYQGNRNNLTTDDTDLAGGNILGRWRHKLEHGGDVTVQMYYDRTQRDIPQTFGEDRDTFDIDFQYHIPLGARHDFTFGLGYRVSADDVTNSAAIVFVPDHQTQQLFSAFVQDEIQLVPDKLRLTIGAKFEQNEFTGFEIQPNARLLWMIDPRQAAWAAISRAVRTPTRLERDLQIIAPTVSLLGNKNFESENVIAYELGYRIQPSKLLALDLATFYNNYDNLRSLEVNGTQYTIENQANGQTYGLELGATLKPADWWVFRAAYTYLQVQLQTDPGSTDTTTIASEGNDPEHQFYLRSSMDLPHHLDLDCTLRYVSELASQNVPAYTAFDVRLAWRPTQQFELAIVGQNLFDNQHLEFGASANRHEIERGVFATLTFRW